MFNTRTQGRLIGVAALALGGVATGAMLKLIVPATHSAAAPADVEQTTAVALASSTGQPLTHALSAKRSTESPNAASPATNAPETDALSGQVAQLSRDLAALASTVDTLVRENMQRAEDVGELDGPPTPEELEQELLNREAREREEQLAQIEELEFEEVDVEWADRTRADIRASVTAGLAAADFDGITFDGIECRSTFCRLDLSAQDLSATSRVMTLLPFPADATFHRDEDGQGGSWYVKPREDSENEPQPPEWG